MNNIPTEIVNKILIYNIHPVAEELNNISKKIKKGSIIINNFYLSNLNQHIEYEVDDKNTFFLICSRTELNLHFYSFYVKSYFISEAILCFINRNKYNCKSSPYLIKCRILFDI